MDRTDRGWLVPLTGAAFVVLVIVGFIVGGEPPSIDDDSAAEITEFYKDNKDSVMFGSGIAVVASTLFVFFGAYLRRALSTVEGENGMLPAIAFAGTVVFAIGVAIDGTISFALADSADDISPQAVESLSALWNNDFLPLALGLQLLFLATGLSLVRHAGVLPKWLGWVALLLGVVAVTPVGFVAFMAGGVWVLIASVMLALRARDRQPPSAAAPAAEPPPVSG